MPGSPARAWQFHSFIGVNPLQTTWPKRGIVSGRVALLPRSAEIQPPFHRFSDWTPNRPITPLHYTLHTNHLLRPARGCLTMLLCARDAQGACQRARRQASTASERGRQRPPARPPARAPRPRARARPGPAQFAAALSGSPSSATAVAAHAPSHAAVLTERRVCRTCGGKQRTTPLQATQAPRRSPAALWPLHDKPELAPGTGHQP